MTEELPLKGNALQVVSVTRTEFISFPSLNNPSHNHIMGEQEDKKPEAGAVEHINLKVVGAVSPPLNGNHPLGIFASLESMERFAQGRGISQVQTWRFCPALECLNIRMLSSKRSTLGVCGRTADGPTDGVLLT